MIGESGAGKTTLSDVLLGLLQPQKGNVFMDGMDVYGMPVAWAQIVGYVPQSVFLLDDTVRKEYCVWAGGSGGQRDLVCSGAGTVENICGKPAEGLDTVVGERELNFQADKSKDCHCPGAL